MTDIIQQQDHKSITDAIDEAFVEAVSVETELRIHYQFRRGNPDEIAIRFYFWFGKLLNLTSWHKSIKDDPKAEPIVTRARFILNDAKPDKDRRLEAMQVFEEYRALLAGKGIITITR